MYLKHLVADQLLPRLSHGLFYKMGSQL